MKFRSLIAVLATLTAFAGVFAFGCSEALTVPSLADVKSSERRELQWNEGHDESTKRAIAALAETEEQREAIEEQVRVQQALIGEIRAQVDAYEGTFQTAGKQIAALIEQITGIDVAGPVAMVEAKLGRRIHDAEQGTRRAELTAAHLETRIADLKERVGSLNAQALAEIEEAKDESRAAFESQLREKLGATDAEIAAVKGLESEEIYGLIMATVSAIVAMELRSRSGKSRSQGDVDALKERMARMEAANGK